LKTGMPVQFPGCPRTPFGREAELRQQLFEGRGGAERVHADDRAGVPDVPFPAERGCLFDRDPGAYRRGSTWSRYWRGCRSNSSDSRIAGRA
jgi:hypothetical protein